MADEKVNVSPEEKKAPEAPAPSGPGDPPAPEHTEGPAVPGGDQTAPAHVEPAMPEKTEGPIKPEQSVIPGMGEDAPAPSGKVINLSDIQAADKGGKEASAPAPEKKAPEADTSSLLPTTHTQKISVSITPSTGTNIASA